MSTVRGWHASPARGAAPTSNPATGEIRAPLSLFNADPHQGHAPLVPLPCGADELHASLSYLSASRPAGVDAAEASSR